MNDMQFLLPKDEYDTYYALSEPPSQPTSDLPIDADITDAVRYNSKTMDPTRWSYNPFKPNSGVKPWQRGVSRILSNKWNRMLGGYGLAASQMYGTPAYNEFDKWVGDMTDEQLQRLYNARMEQLERGID